MRTLYCRSEKCRRAIVLEDGEDLQACPACRGRYFGSEPLAAADRPLTWTEQDLRFLRSLRITIGTTGDNHEGA
jgi:hypothetical protein